MQGNISEGTAMAFESWKLPCQTLEAQHSHLAPGTAQASSHPKPARGICGMEEFYHETVYVENKPLKFRENVQGEFFLSPRHRKMEKRTGRGKGKKTPNPS